MPTPAAAVAATNGPTVIDEPPPPLRVLYEDAHLLAIDKPAGLLVHRSALDAHERDDVLTRLAAQRGQRLWPAHRLDKGTSGVLLLAQDAATARALGLAFAAGAVRKRYLALVRGWPPDTGCTDAPLARDPECASTGQPLLAARTRWQTLQRLEWPVTSHPAFATTRGALVAVWPETGRRHQIRRHFKQLAHPLIGDATHGKGPLNRALAAYFGCQRLWLHAQELAFEPPGGGPALVIESPAGPQWQCVERGAAAVSV